MFFIEPQHLNTSRGQFTYREGGDAGGSPVVMIHGWPECSYTWEHMARHLKPGLRVIAPDLRGLGDSERTAGQTHYSKQALAQDVVAMLDHLGIKQFQLIGHDWGGVVAQEVALAVAHRVEKMVIMNMALINNLKGNMAVAEQVKAKGSKAYWYQHFQQAPGLAEAMIPGNEETWLRFFLGGWGKPLPEDSIAEYIRMYRIPGTAGAAANYYREFENDAKRWGGLTEHVWPMPSLYIYGNKDPVIIPTYLRNIENCFDRIEVKEVEAGHFVHEEQPEEVAKHLNAFLHAAG